MSKSIEEIKKYFEANYLDDGDSLDDYGRRVLSANVCFGAIKDIIEQDRKERDEELRKTIAEYQIDLCDNSQAFKQFVLSLLTPIKN